ncbi:protein phosphatase 2C family protein [Pseudomonas costantinii]|nr:protein phosphatase 2C family protein [Pseudomonas costantinii]
MIRHLSLSRQGADTTENRDVSGSAENTGAYLYVIADGTSKPGSGELARALTHHLLDVFSRTAPSIASCPDKALQLTLTSLNEVRSNLCPVFPFASTSYLALLVVGQTAASIHAGDCCLGHLGEDQRINWLNPPHCGPNWKGDLSHSFIASSPARKRLLNCMSYRRPHEPAVQSIQTTADTTWILATDGFWAELSIEHQLNAIAQRSLDGHSTEDDVTFMLLQM